MLHLDCRRLPQKVQNNVTKKVMSIMRGVLAGVPGYVVFAGAALYIQGKSKRLPELAGCPGDFDMAVSSERSFAMIRNRIGSIPGAHLDFEGVPRHIKHEKSWIVSGYFPVPVTLRGKRESLAYPFELFFHSRIVKDRLMKNHETVDGFHVLTLTGLEEQYLQNLSFETKLHDRVVAAVKRLLLPHNEQAIRHKLDLLTFNPAKKSAQWFMSLMKQLSVTQHELQLFYQAVDAARKRRTRGFLSNETFLSHAAKLLAGTNMKIEERCRNVHALHTVIRKV